MLRLSKHKSGAYREASLDAVDGSADGLCIPYWSVLEHQDHLTRLAKPTHSLVALRKCRKDCMGH